MPQIGSKFAISSIAVIIMIPIGRAIYSYHSKKKSKSRASRHQAYHPVIDVESVEQASDEELDRLFSIVRVLVYKLNMELIDTSGQKKLYGLHKQAIKGDAPRDSRVDMRKSAWYEHKGMTSRNAKIEYIKFYSMLKDKERLMLMI